MSKTPRTDVHTEPAMDMTGERLLVRFDQLARESRALETELAHEREECAKICDYWATQNHVYVNGAIVCAKDIRARSVKA